MDQQELALLRLRMRVVLLERLVLSTAFVMPLLSSQISEQQNCDRLKDMLDKNGSSGDQAFGAQFPGDPARAGLYAEEWKAILDDMKATVDQIFHNFEP